MFRAPVSCLTLIAFLFSLIGFEIPAQAMEPLLNLPMPGSMVLLSPAYEPVMIKGLRVHPNQPLNLDFIVDTGNSTLNVHSAALKDESNKLIKYFFAALTLPEQDVWVNLSPYEKNRIIPDTTGQTEMGRDLLAQDYLLKQITASLIYPERGLGKDFWNKIYAQAEEKFGTDQIPVNTFNKVWIVADKATVYEANDTVLVIDAHLKVMLEEDYLAINKHLPTHTPHALASQIVRQIILPALEKEVNEGKNFANLRQIFHSIILAKWYKESLKTALLNQVYSNKNKVAGVDVADKGIDEKIYQRYLQAYKKGVFNYIKEDLNQSTRQRIPRKYFSGGIVANMNLAMLSLDQFRSRARDLFFGHLLLVGVSAKKAGAHNAAMIAEPVILVDEIPEAIETAKPAATQGQDIFMEWFPIEGTELHSGESTYIPGKSQRLHFFWKRNGFDSMQPEQYLELNPEDDGRVSVFTYSDRGKLELGGAINEGDKIDLPGTTLIFNGEGYICKYNGSDFLIIADAAMSVERARLLTHRISSRFLENQSQRNIQGLASKASSRKKPLATTTVIKSVNMALAEIDSLIHQAVGIHVPYSSYIKMTLASIGLRASKAKTESDWKLLELQVDRDWPQVQEIIEKNPELEKILNQIKIIISTMANAAMDSTQTNKFQIWQRGGIDLNASKIDLQHEGSGIHMNFDPAMIAQFRSENFQGIVPVITSIVPINNIYLILGLKQPLQKMQFASL